VVDLVVDAVPAPPETNGMISFQVWIDYSPDILEVTSADYEFLLGATGSFSPIEAFGDDTPDTDGRFSASIVDAAVNDPANGDNVETGPGVLARITLTAKAQGVATVAPAVDPSDTNPEAYEAYPAVYANQNLPYQVESVAGAMVAVGQDCPVPPESTPAATTVPRLDETLVAQNVTPAPPGGSTGEPTPGSSGDGATEPTPTNGASGQEPGGSDGTGDDDGNNITNVEESDGGVGAGTIALVAGLAVAGVAFAAVGGRMLLSQRARRNTGPE
jgi:hypothetical protein